MENGLYLYRHPKTGIQYVRGSYLGKRVDKSARTRSVAAANGVLKGIEREIYAEIALGVKPKRQRTFAEAAHGYMSNGGERAHLTRILLAQIEVEDDNGRASPIVFGAMVIEDIDQAAINAVAKAIYPDGTAKDSTRNRRVYTPISAVLTWASRQKKWRFAHSRIERPQQPKGRIEFLTPQQVEWWLERAGHIKPLLTAYVGTGMRASELLHIDWSNISPAGTKLTLWEDETKAGVARSIDLQHRVRAVLPSRPFDGKGPVWLKPDGDPWHAYDAINTILWRITEREALTVATASEAEEIAACKSKRRTWRKVPREDREAAAKRAGEIVTAIIAREGVPTLHLHALRHTWATWANAVTGDIPWMMAQGGWASPNLVMRYAHAASIELKEDVLAHGWEMRPGLAGPAGLADHRPPLARLAKPAP